MRTAQDTGGLLGLRRRRRLVSSSGYGSSTREGTTSSGRTSSRCTMRVVCSKQGVTARGHGVLRAAARAVHSSSRASRTWKPHRLHHLRRAPAPTAPRARQLPRRPTHPHRLRHRTAGATGAPAAAPPRPGHGSSRAMPNRQRLARRRTWAAPPAVRPRSSSPWRTGSLARGAAGVLAMRHV